MENFFKSLFGKSKKILINNYNVNNIVINAVQTTTINNITDIISGNKRFNEAMNDIACQGARVAVNEYVIHQLPDSSPLKKIALDTVNGQQSLEEALSDMVQQKAQMAVNNYICYGSQIIIPEKLSGSSFENSVISNITDIIVNDRRLEDALGNIALEGAKTAVNNCLSSEYKAEMSRLLYDSTNAVQSLLKEANVSEEIFTAFIDSKDTLFKWVSGDIPTHRCLLDLSEKATSLAVSGYSATIGQVLVPIPVIGGMIGSAVGSALTGGLFNQFTAGLRRKDIEFQARQKRIIQYNFAAEAERQYRKQLEVYLEEYFREYRHYFDSALAEIDNAFAVGDADGIISGANKITRKLGGIVKYETVEEFKSFLDSDKPDVF